MKKNLIAVLLGSVMLVANASSTSKSNGKENGESSQNVFTESFLSSSQESISSSHSSDTSSLSSTSTSNSQVNSNNASNSSFSIATTQLPPPPSSLPPPPSSGQSSGEKRSSSSTPSSLRIPLSNESEESSKVPSSNLPPIPFLTANLPPPPVAAIGSQSSLADMKKQIEVLKAENVELRQEVNGAFEKAKKSVAEDYARSDEERKKAHEEQCKKQEIRIQELSNENGRLKKEIEEVKLEKEKERIKFNELKQRLSSEREQEKLQHDEDTRKLEEELKKEKEKVEAIEKALSKKSEEFEACYTDLMEQCKDTLVVVEELKQQKAEVEKLKETNRLDKAQWESFEKGVVNEREAVYNKNKQLKEMYDKSQNDLNTARWETSREKREKERAIKEKEEALKRVDDLQQQMKEREEATKIEQEEYCSRKLGDQLREIISAYNEELAANALKDPQLSRIMGSVSLTIKVNDETIEKSIIPDLISELKTNLKLLGRWLGEKSRKREQQQNSMLKMKEDQIKELSQQVSNLKNELLKYEQKNHTVFGNSGGGGGGGGGSGYEIQSTPYYQQTPTPVMTTMTTGGFPYGTSSNTYVSGSHDNYSQSSTSDNNRQQPSLSQSATVNNATSNMNNSSFPPQLFSNGSGNTSYSYNPNMSGGFNDPSAYSQANNYNKNWY